MKQAIIGIIAVVAIIGGAVVFGKDSEQAVLSNHVTGNEQASVTLVEYGDFNCRACAGYYSLLNDLKSQFADSMRFEFRHFPLLQNLGPHRAAEAAGKQGKFWEMHDLLFERWDSWVSLQRQSASGGHGGSASSIPDTAAQNAVFESYAEEIGLDMDQYRSDFADESTIATVNADFEQAQNDGGEGTPTFLLNGQRIEDLSSVDTPEKFAAIIQQKIDEANGVESTPAPADDAAAETTGETEEGIPVEINTEPATP